MAISMCVAAPPRIVPAYSSFLRRTKGLKIYPNNSVVLTQSGRISSPISFPQAKASPFSLEIISTFSEKDDGEVQKELDRLQNAWEMLKGFFGEIILVLVAINPISRLLCDAMMLKNRCIRRSSFGASYGALLVLNGFVKILWKSQPIWSYNVILGFLIYKAHMRNIAQLKKGHDPFWLIPLFGVSLVKLCADMFSLTWMPVNFIWVSLIEIAVSGLMIPFILDI